MAFIESVKYVLLNESTAVLFKMKISKLNFKSLIKATIDVLRINNLQANDLKSYSLNFVSSNIWFQIAEKYLKKPSSYNDALSIYFSWKRNAEYREEVEAVFEPQKSKFKHKINANWEELKTFISDRTSRTYFLSEFSEYISTRLQDEFDFNCNLKSSYNWFSTKSKYNSNLPFWSGVFLCRESDCKQEYKLTIDKIINGKVSIVVRYENLPCHTQKVPIKPRCRGVQRLEEAKNILSLGSVTNAVIHNTLQAKNGTSSFDVYLMQ